MAEQCIRCNDTVRSLLHAIHWWFVVESVMLLFCRLTLHLPLAFLVGGRLSCAWPLGAVPSGILVFSGGDCGLCVLARLKRR